jgi:hypothetical protein
VQDGQAVYVRVRFLEKGQIGTRLAETQPVDILVDEDGKESRRYKPAKGPDPEVEGMRYYKLAKFVNKDSDLEMELAGSNITYLRLLGRNLNLVVRAMFETTNGLIYLEPEPVTTLCWRDGIYVGDYEDQYDIPLADGDVDVREVVHFTGRDA